MHKNLTNWLALFHTEGIGPAKFKEYLQKDPNLDQLPEIAQKDLHLTKALIELDLQWARQENHYILLLCEDCYPTLLKEISVPPPILFVYGNKDLLLKIDVIYLFL